jgi:hypothetical protein
LKTIAENKVLSPEERKEILKEAKGGTWYDGWKPFCFAFQGKECTSPRMLQEDYGFRCPDCGNLIGWDCMRLEESPLNNSEYVKFLEGRAESTYKFRYSRYTHH